MKLTKSEVKILKKFGNREKDIPQIERALGKTVFTLCDKNGKSQRISSVKAKKILGIEQFLSGISRSAFHWDSCREVNENYFVYFDTSKLFE